MSKGSYTIKRCVPCDTVYGFQSRSRDAAYCPTCGWKLQPTSLPVDIEGDALTKNGALALITEQTEILRRIARDVE